MLEFHAATDSDSDFIRQCMEELKQAPFDPVIFAETWEGLQSCRSYSGFIISSAEIPCGFLGINILPQLHHNGKVAEILELVILPAFRKREIGKAALDFARGFAKKENCLVLELATNQQRLDAQRFYLRNGFRDSHFKLTMEL